jgi:hypothetical protein
MLWNREGQLVERRGPDDWSAVAEVEGGGPIAYAFRDEDGLLLAREKTGAHPNELLLVGPDGRIADRWAFAAPAESAFEERHRRWLVTNDALTPLEPHAKLGRPEPLDAAFAPKQSLRLPPELLAHGPDGVVVCLPTSAFVDDGYAGVCTRTGPRAWRAQDPYSDPTISCGDWLVHRGGKQLAIRSLETGKIEREKTFPKAPQVACVGPATLAVSQGRRLSLLALPALEPASAGVATAPAEITRLVALGDGAEILVDQNHAAGFWVASRSCLLSSPSASETRGRPRR